MIREPISGNSSGPRHEEVVARLNAVFIIASSVILMLVVCLAVSRAILHHYAHSRPMQSMQPLGILTAPDNRALTLFPAPNLELDDGHADSTALHARQFAHLNNYGWVDRSNHIAHIPIERAMDLIILRGLPVATNLHTVTGSLRLPADQERTLP